MERLKQELIELGTFAAERGWLPATSGNLSQRIDDYNFIITSSGCHKGKLTQDNFVIVDSRLDSVDWNKSCTALDERAGLDKTESNKNLCLKSLSEKLPDARHASPSERSLLDINEHREGEHNNADGTFRTGSKPSAETLLHSHLYRDYPEIGAIAHIHSRLSVLLSIHHPSEELILRSYELLKAIGTRTSHEDSLCLPIFNNTQRIADLAQEVTNYLSSFDGPLDHWAYLIRGHGLYVWAPNMQDLYRHLEAIDMLLDFEWSKRTLICRD